MPKLLTSMRKTVVTIVLALITALSFQSAEAAQGVKAARATKAKAVHAAKAAPVLRLASHHAIVVDAANGRPLVSKDAAATVPIASITKLMTAMVVLDAKLPMDETLTVTSDDVDMLKHSYSRVRVGTQHTRYEMLRMALMSSENRAASALGRHYPGGRKAFVKAMQAKAKKLGMADTHFADSTGLSPQNMSTAQDLVKMVTAANNYQTIRNFTTTQKNQVRFTKPTYTLGFNNTNALVRNKKWDINVSKTGYTNEAGRCLVMMANVARRQVIMVFLDADGKYSPVGDANRIKTWLERTGGNTVIAQAPAAPAKRART
jgi:D-alanyl-D-alanine endopeptidase (penicillin-binding protein 7)